MKRMMVAALAALAVAACGDETPTGVGGGLLPPDAVRTFEVFLEGPQYLVRDTAFGEYADPRDAGFLVVARQFEGALNAHSLVRFGVPTAITVLANGTARVDSTPAYLGGTVRLIVDTLYTPREPVLLALYRTNEVWDPSATWTHRVDTAGVRLPWAQPGALGGALIDTATWRGGADTVVFRVDGATLAQWADTLNRGRGAVITAQTTGTRLRAFFPTLTARLGSDLQPDTVVETQGALQGATFIVDPWPATVSSDPRIGGAQAWRTILQFRERMDTITVPCPGVPNCRLRMDQVTVNHASLQLRPVAPPAGFRPEGDITMAPFGLLPSPLLPLQRSPLGSLISLGQLIPATRFLAPATPTAVVPINITEFVRTVAAQDTILGGVVPSHVALTPLEPRMFGFSTFESMPRLRLIVSVARELQLP